MESFSLRNWNPQRCVPHERGPCRIHQCAALHDYVHEKGSLLTRHLSCESLIALHRAHPYPRAHYWWSLIAKYMAPMVNKIGITWQRFMDKGRATRHQRKISERIRTEYCARDQWRKQVAWHGFPTNVSTRLERIFPQELHVSYVTNGIHPAGHWSKQCTRSIFDRFTRTSPMPTYGKYTMSDDDLNCAHTWKKADRLHPRRIQRGLAKIRQNLPASWTWKR